MSNLKRILVGMLILTLLGVQMAPQRAAAQAGTKTYEVTVTNITTSKQGLSPIVIATHPASVHAWQMGQMASKGLEVVAEDGMPDMLASELKGNATDVVATHSHLLPGDSITVTITAKDGDVLSAATMLIQTNDGFTGLDNAALTDGSTDTMAYDAGTEENTEKATDVPGPPFGGKSNSPDTSPHQPIALHTGITGKADVTPDFNWTGPVARFTVRAITPATVAPGMRAFDVTVTNITKSMQGLSPLVVATHPASAHAWQMGQMASKGVEILAEDGMPAMLADELKGVATDVAATKSHLFPGDSITVRVMAKDGDVLSAATMLIQTNDGFTGLDSVALNEGDTDAMAYDAGTEENTEAAADVPGPPFGGMMHGPDSTPHQPISMHQGITGKADVKPEMFNWTGPVARFSVRAVVPNTAAPPAQPAPPTVVPPAVVPPAPPPVVAPPAPPAQVPPVVASTPVVPTMPKTGAGDWDMWPLAAVAGALFLLGLFLRRRSAFSRR
ncbi:MAG TPA: spondin domain-containing protein [Chloroflexia bacterium]|jgi:archaellum component FlaF (FlaF/FlaG flagellin family)